MDPNDPLIPMPWQMDQIRAYRERKALEDKKLRLELEEKMRQTPTGKIQTAEMLAGILERSRQGREGVSISPEVFKMATSEGGPSLLGATKIEGEMLTKAAQSRARDLAIQNILIGGKGVVPSAKIDVGGFSAQVPLQYAGQEAKSAYSQIYESMVPMVAKTYVDQGYSDNDAFVKAVGDARNQLIRAPSSGKIMLVGADGISASSYTNEEAERMWRDPNTPEHLKKQLIGFFGPVTQSQQRSSASDWVKSRTGR